MRQYKIILSILAIVICSNLTAQVSPTSFNDYTITLKCDSTTRSAMISNLLAEKVGSGSPIIGAAAWTDSVNKNLQCRSLLAFDFEKLISMVSPEQVVEATLILKPLEILTVESATTTPASSFLVQRITGHWDNENINWVSQPAAETRAEVKKQINTKKNQKVIRVDVTQMVKNMFSFGNNGFMIRFDDSVQSTAFLSRWFGSPMNEDVKSRPELEIRMSFPPNYNLSAMPGYNNSKISTPNIQGVPLPPSATTEVPTAPVKDSPKPKGNQ